MSATPSLAITTVAAGWNLMQTIAPTSFMGVNFVGVALGSYDFGGAIGVHGTGHADTVIQRLADASVTDPVPPSAVAPPVPIKLVALQLRSAAPVDFGAGLDYYFITLQSLHGGPASTGQMTIGFDSAVDGTFTSAFDVFFDLRIGCLSCAIVFSGDQPLAMADPVPWTRTPPPNAVVIDGVNTTPGPSGGNQLNDFWPVGPVIHGVPAEGTAHTVVPATVPEPASWALMAGGFGLVGAGMRRRSRTRVSFG
jgi:hypothetical protein